MYTLHESTSSESSLLPFLTTARTKRILFRRNPLYTFFSYRYTHFFSTNNKIKYTLKFSVVCTAVGAKLYTLSIDVSLLEKSLPAYHSLERFAHHLFRSNTDTKLITQM